MSAAQADSGAWNVAAYEAFNDLRLRPALDLLARVFSLPPGDIIDLGCGSGQVGGPLTQRFSNRVLRGVDASADMLTKAEGLGIYESLQEADIADWTLASPPALIFSNAALHWLGGHEVLIPRLFGLLAPGGSLAVQMPSQLHRPSHQTMCAAATAIRPDLFEDWAPFPGPLAPGDYAALLPDAEIEIWLTEYHQRLPASVDGAHPVRSFSASTAGRPVLAKLTKDEATEFFADWDGRLDDAYPRLPDGGAWFPFQRMFFVAQKAAV